LGSPQSTENTETDDLVKKSRFSVLSMPSVVREQFSAHSAVSVVKRPILDAQTEYHKRAYRSACSGTTKRTVSVSAVCGVTEQ
jgi:hypothetical protein